MRISDWSSDVCSSDLLFGRVPVGDKGLGRLAALRLGKRVVLKTRPISNPGIEHCLRIDWEEFITVEHVEDVGIEVLSYEVEQGHGTDVAIEAVSTRFGRTAVNKLARSLLLLSDPFRGATDVSAVNSDTGVSDAPLADPGFSARLESPEFSDLAAKVANSYFGDAQYCVIATIDNNGKLTYRMEDWKGDVLHEDVGGFTYRTPELTFRLWVFILDQQSFSTRTSTVGEVREWLAEVGGVHVYEDGIRVQIGRASCRERECQYV